MEYKTPRSPNYKTLLKRYAQRKIDEDLSVSRIKFLTATASELLAFMEHRGVWTARDIRQDDLEAFMAYLGRKRHARHGGGISAAYIEQYRSAIGVLACFVFKVDTSPFDLPVVNVPPTEYGNIPTVAQVKTLFNACGTGLLGDRDRALLALLYGCGLRRSEAHLLDVADVDLHRATVWVRRGKTGAQRLVPISPGTKDHLERYRYRTRPLLAPDASENGFLVGKYGKRLSKVGIGYRVKDLGKKAGLTGLSPHALRHAIATHLVDSLPLEDIARFLGHNCLDSTQIYTHIHQLQNTGKKASKS